MLSQTPTKVSQRSALRINPAKTCQPIGAMYAASGIHNCLPYSHGSQGCCSYHRSHLTRHFKEPFMAATSSFTEGASVFGGQPNLLQGLRTAFAAYDPDVIAVNTTCLSETIGDDIPQIIGEAESSGIIPEGKFVIHANTPSYDGSHVTGFSNMCVSMVKYFATRIEDSSEASAPQLNIVPGFVDPADMREIRRLAESVGFTVTMFPDTAGVLDAPQTGSFQMYPDGGVTVDELRNLGRGVKTLALGPFASAEAALQLDKIAGVPHEVLDLPVGIAATDRFIGALNALGAAIPDEITTQRGQLVDLMCDVQQHFYNKKVAIFGDPDHVLSLTEFCRDLGMIPVHILTGTPGKAFGRKATEILGDKADQTNIEGEQDLFLLHQLIKNQPVDLLVGTSYGKYIARAEDIPFVRFGWPILDRFGHALIPSLGYAGAIQLISKMSDALLDRRDRDSTEWQFELVL
ncbi:nitrogenase molybdenum-iron protein beta chain [Propionibacterium cyclohexanicum]|uniref:Nitrogenase molybdenum-iron protein beta chain n=1 Tax=Propionibacterium cyclohexanicum TaxID=64702 RepID=A0A1H9TY90_9ACTN|nr:nitrogenase component 1 [Propionibacterium cyclohexanicum]SES02340.1 nitrogenase molybdenum-iron protein beta chain [Propionibacterium cyclohexanicum]